MGAVRSSGRVSEAALFASVTLAEPDQGGRGAHRPGDPVERQVRLLIVPGPEASVIEVVVAAGPGQSRRVDDRATGCARPSCSTTRTGPSIALRATRSGRRPCAAGASPTSTRSRSTRGRPATSGNPLEEDRRIARCLSYYRESPPTTGTPAPSRACWPPWTRPAARSSRSTTSAWSPSPRGPGSYYPEDNEPLRTDLRAAGDRPARRAQLHPRRQPAHLAAVVHAGVDGPARRAGPPHRRLRGRRAIRPILHRASINEMVVPYGDPGPIHGWKNAFDVGEWGLGRMANSLALGCDCLGEITYLDAVFSSEHGKPYVVENAICIHEEDYGILWKHNDMNIGRTEVRRSRRLVVSSIATVGNYEYGFYWYFYLDGTIQLEVKLTGIMSTQAVAPGEQPAFALAGGPGTGRPGPSAPVLRPPRRGRRRSGQRGLRGLCRAAARRGRQPVGQRLPSARRSGSTPNWRPARGRPGARSPLEVRQPRLDQRTGRPVAYKLVPGATPDPAGPSGLEHRPAGPASPATTCGSPRSPPTSAGRPATTPTNTPVGTACPAGPRPTGPSSIPTSWRGTPSGSPTSPGPRTGRSCRSSTADSTSFRSVSSIRIRHSIFLLPSTPASDLDRPAPPVPIPLGAAQAVTCGPGEGRSSTPPRALRTIRVAGGAGTGRRPARARRAARRRSGSLHRGGDPYPQRRRTRRPAASRRGEPGRVRAPG